MTDCINGLMDMQRVTERTLRDVLNVSARIGLCTSKSLPSFEGKAKRVIDKRG